MKAEHIADRILLAGALSSVREALRDVRGAMEEGRLTTALHDTEAMLADVEQNLADMLKRNVP